LPGASEPRLKLLRPQDFRSVFQTALRGLGNRSIVVVGNYECGPITVEPCRAKARPLRPRRSYFAPVSAISNQWSPHQRLLTTDPLMVEAPGTAPGSDGFITTAVYCHSRLAPALLNIGAQGGRKKSMGTAAPMLAREWRIYVALARNGAASRSPGCGGQRRHAAEARGRLGAGVCLQSAAPLPRPNAAPGRNVLRSGTAGPIDQCA
jgi:hypothetical protein